MQDMNELLLKSVDTIPPLPDTIFKLKKYCDEAKSEIETNKVAEIISSDPIVTAKLLQLANSPFYGFSREISTINQVITLLGIGNIKNTVMANSVKDNFAVDVSPYGLDTPTFLASCNDEVSFITAWLGDEDKRLSHSLVPCAMLLRLGMIVFSNFLIQNKKDKEFYERLKSSNFEYVSMVEEEFLGVDHISFLGFLLHRWNFDENMIECICFVHTPHSADGEVKKAAYALAIAAKLFSPHKGGSAFNTNAAIALLKEAINVGVKFDLDNFLAKLPEKAKANLN